MHPEVQSSKPGKCPKCGMKLIAQKKRPAVEKFPTSTTAVDQTPTPPPAPQRNLEVVQQTAEYTCTMHPEIRTNGPGTCPKCEMTLVPVVPAVGEDFNLKLDSTPKMPK